MAGETINLRGAEVTIASSLGATVASNAMSGALGSYSTSDTADKPDAEFAFNAEFGGTPAVGSIIELHVRPLNIHGTNDTPVPTASYKPHRLCSFVVKDSASQWLFAVARNLPKEGELYLYNNNTTQTLQTTCALYMVPLTLKPA